jgi:hypothetical protein
MDQKFISGIINKVLVFVLCILPILLALLWYPDFLGDDTYIHIGFILGFLNGEGFSFTGNVTYGSTSPIWVVMTAIISFVTGDPEFSIRLISGVFTFLSGFMFLKLADSLKFKSSIKFFAALSFCFNPFFLRWAVSGMEATTAIFVLLLLIYTFHKKLHVAHPYIYGLILGMSFLLRPEFIVFFMIFILYQFIINPAFRNQTLKSFLSGIIIIFTWLWFAYFHFGTIVPNTYRAKAAGGFFSMSYDGTVRNIKLLLGGNIPEFLLLGIIIITVFIIVAKKNQKFVEDFVNLMDRFRNTGVILAVIFFISFYAYYTVKDVTIISRYSLMFVPLIILVTASFINLLTDYKTQVLLSLIAIYAVLVLLIHTHITFTVVKPASDMFVEGFQKSYKEIAAIIKSDSNNYSKTVALNDVGIVGCYSGAKVIDLAGLVDGDRFNYTTIKEFVTAKKPDYLVLRNEIEYDETIPDNISNEILYQKLIPGFGINSLEERTVTLYRLHWQ